MCGRANMLEVQIYKLFKFISAVEQHASHFSFIKLWLNYSPGWVNWISSQMFPGYQYEYVQLWPDNAKVASSVQTIFENRLSSCLLHLTSILKTAPRVGIIVCESMYITLTFLLVKNSLNRTSWNFSLKSNNFLSMLLASGWLLV